MTSDAEARSGVRRLPSPGCTFIEDGEGLAVAGVQAAGRDGEPGRDSEAGDRESGGDVAGSEELVVQQLVDGGAGRGVRLKHLLDEGGGHGVDVLEQRERRPLRDRTGTRRPQRHEGTAGPVL